MDMQMLYKPLTARITNYNFLRVAYVISMGILYETYLQCNDMQILYKQL